MKNKKWISLAAAVAPMVGITALVTMAMNYAEPALQKPAKTMDIAQVEKYAKQQRHTLAILTANVKIVSTVLM